MDHIKYYLKYGAYFIVYKIFMKNILRLFGVQYPKGSFAGNESQFILVANHNSHLDTMVILSMLPIKKSMDVYSIGAKDYFGKSKLVMFLLDYLVNISLINRKGGGNTIAEIDAILKNGKSILIFPEGSRGKPGVIQDFKIGVAVLLKRNPDIPYIPIYLDKLERIMPKGDPIPIPYSSEVIVGDPQKIKPEQECEEIIHALKESIVNLGGGKI